jgi:polyhydroxybutyrate depolymerase
MGREFYLRLVLFALVALTPALFLPPALQGARAEPGCGEGGDCLIADGAYRVWRPVGKVPPASGWSVLIHFHGFRETAVELLAREDLRAFAQREGILLAFPQGRGNTWSHPGSPAQERDEFRFHAAMMADLGLRFPIDRQRILISGFSQGAAMVWNLACHAGDPAIQYVAIAGTYWRPQPETCPSPVVSLIHIHGVADRTVPLEGRPIRGGAFHQGDVFKAVTQFRARPSCPLPDTRTERHGALACARDAGCQGVSLMLCLHPGGHDFDPGWIEWAWQMRRQSPKG